MAVNNKHIFISAGEASGDLLGANLAKALFNASPNIQLTGMGSTRMEKAGVDICIDSKKLAVVGLFEVITHLPDILKVLRRIKKHLKNTRPNLVVLIDFPDTHFIISKMAKKLGIPVLYYVSPQLWAWRPKRIKHIQKYVDHMAVLFAFEKALYEKAGVPVTFVGHPLVDVVKPSMSKEATFKYFQLNPKKRFVALLPGSRQSEITMHLPILIEMAKTLYTSHPDVQFVLPLASHLNESDLPELPDFITVCRDHLYDLLQISHCAIAVSGTVTLEIAMMDTPFCIFYKLNALTYQVAKRFVDVKYIGLCNIVAQEMVAKEFVQEEATPNALALEIKRLLDDTDYYQKKQTQLNKVKENLGPGDGAKKVASIAEQLISQNA